jgi:hypothetical protein
MLRRNDDAVFEQNETGEVAASFAGLATKPAPTAISNRECVPGLNRSCYLNFGHAGDRLPSWRT